MEDTGGSVDGLTYNNDGSYRTSNEQLIEDDGEEEDEEAGVSRFGAIFIVCNAALGAGLLNFPHAYALAGGWPVCLGMQLGVMLLALIGLHFLASGARAHSVTTYQEVVKFGAPHRYFGLLAMIFIIIYTFGCCITFEIVLGDQMEAIFGALLPDNDSWYLDRRFLIPILSLVLIFPLCFPKDIGFLRHAALLGFMSCMFVVMVVVIRYAYPGEGYVPPSPPPPESPQSFTSLLAALPSLLFAYQCHVSAVPVYASMKEKSQNAWMVVVSVSLLLCCIVYTLTGTFGYLTFGLDVNPDILVSYGANDPLVIAARLLMAVAMVTSYPILHFCGRAAFFSITGLDAFALQTPYADRMRKERIRRYSATCVWFLTALLLAVFIPNISDVISVIGSLAAFFILIFPGIIIIQLIVQDRIGWHRNCAAVGQVALGIFFCVLGTWVFGVTFTQAIMDDVNASL